MRTATIRSGSAIPTHSISKRSFGARSESHPAVRSGASFSHVAAGRFNMPACFYSFVGETISSSGQTHATTGATGVEFGLLASTHEHTTDHKNDQRDNRRRR